MASRPWMASWCGGRYTASGAYAAATLSKIPAFQCRAQSLPIWRMMTAALLVLADLRAVRMDLRSAPFARFFAVFSWQILSQKTFAEVFYSGGDTGLRAMSPKVVKLRLS